MKTEERMSRAFMNRCYLPGPGTHERIIQENAKAITGYGFICWSLGRLGGLLVTAICVLTAGGAA